MSRLLRGVFVITAIGFIVWNRCAPLTGLSAADFTVAVATEPAGNATSVMSIAQASAVALLRASLPAAWGSATRGRGRLTVVDTNPGIVMKVIAANGTSIHEASRLRQDIQIYVADDRGRPLSSAALTTTALHELGHIWCCYGRDASGGHWISLADDGPALGVNRYGLMNALVECCPSRFSDRELQALGLASSP